MIAQISLHNFKAFEDLSVDVAPITVLVGPNNSGKSSILAAIRLLAQTLESPDPAVPLLLSGIFGDFGTFKDLVYRNHRGRPFSLSLTLKAPIRHAPTTHEPSTNRILRFDTTFKYRTQRREIVLREF